MAGTATGEDKGFRIARPQAAGAVVFASPHSGAVYPADMAADPDLSRLSLTSAEDARVDALIASATQQGATLLTARIARAYVDLNRAEDELDPVLIPGVGDGGPRAAAGYGVLPRLSGDGRPLYDRLLTAEEAERRLARVHRPYHAALAALMDETRARCGRAVLIDWHSMPSRATQQGTARGPDVVLGDRHGSSCARSVTRAAAEAFEALGWRVALNRPYAGGYTTQIWGRPAEGFHALQIELNRALYWNEQTGEPGPGWGRCLAGVRRVVAALARL